jgi:hypothetical protein
VVKSVSKMRFNHARLLAPGVLLAAAAALLLAGCAQNGPTASKPDGSWNPRAVQTSYAGVRVREIDPSNAAVVFLYDLDNKSQSDYQLAKGTDVVVMSRLKSSKTFSSEKRVTLGGSAFVPANNRTRIALEVNEPFSWPNRMDAASEGRFRDLVAQEVSDLDGFVIFDQAHRFQIDLPGSWPAMEPPRARR